MQGIVPWSVSSQWVSWNRESEAWHGDFLKMFSHQFVVIWFSIGLQCYFSATGPRGKQLISWPCQYIEVSHVRWLRWNGYWFHLILCSQNSVFALCYSLSIAANIVLRTHDVIVLQGFVGVTPVGPQLGVVVLNQVSLWLQFKSFEHNVDGWHRSRDCRVVLMELLLGRFRLGRDPLPFLFQSQLYFPRIQHA